MNRYDEVQAELRAEPKTWLVTGVAGFIGSNLLEQLLLLNQKVVGLDNFSTGYQHNLDEVRGAVTSEQWRQFKFIEGDIRNVEDCDKACSGVNYVLHQAALGSVPRSIEDPITTNSANITGFLNMMVSARNAKVDSFTYAASSSTYGDHPALPKVEENIGKPLSPYAVTKYVNEVYADVFSKTYGFNAVGLRYFNVFGRRQNPNGAYAAVIPKWTAAMLAKQPVFINGTGETSRDFCHVQNAVQANILAATLKADEPNVINVAFSQQTTLIELFSLIKNELLECGYKYDRDLEFKDFRAGDVMHSLADISKAKKVLGYKPMLSVLDGYKATVKWYVNDLGAHSNDD